MQKKRVLFLCTENSARSQMAEGILRHDAGDRFEPYSAGTKPTAVRSEAVEAMAEIGINIREQISKSVLYFDGEQFDFVITLGDSGDDGWPIFPGAARHLHLRFDDPAISLGSNEDGRMAEFRQTRDEIRKRLK